jgi:hypothetical protein
MCSSHMIKASLFIIKINLIHRYREIIRILLHQYIYNRVSLYIQFNNRAIQDMDNSNFMYKTNNH